MDAALRGAPGAPSLRVTLHLVARADRVAALEAAPLSFSLAATKENRGEAGRWKGGAAKPCTR